MTPKTCKELFDTSRKYGECWNGTRLGEPVSCLEWIDIKFMCSIKLAFPFTLEECDSLRKLTWEKSPVEEIIIIMNEALEGFKVCIKQEGIKGHRDDFRTLDEY